MQGKFTLEELLTRAIPGGFLLAILLFVFVDKANLAATSGLDFLYTFVFLCSAFIVGELLQTLAHAMEWLIDIFFRFRRPSKVFLYKNNPVINNEHTRSQLIKHLELSDEENTMIDREYSSIPMFFKRRKELDSFSQSIFWKLYSRVSDTPEMKLSNTTYLFTRVMMVEFLLLSIVFLVNGSIMLMIPNILIFVIFLWRSRGVARGLVFKTVLLNLKN